jgi:hemerythrin
MPTLALPEFEWSEGFTCGVDLIDRQHRNLVDIINLLRQAILRDDPVSSANSVESLQAYARYHFAYEESWARAHGMPQAALDQHARRHQAFADRIQAMAERDGREDGDGRALHHYLCTWLADHIVKEDREMVRRLLHSGGAKA